MTDATHFMLCSVFACVAGYPDSILKQYADVFQKILDNDKHLQGKEWDSHKVYENDKKYFGKGGAE